MAHEALSVVDMFKIGIGPSSSHTLGPWRAVLRCLETMNKKGGIENVGSVTVLLYGSLAKTGVGHGTDIAVQLGLGGEDPVTINVNTISIYIYSIQTTHLLNLGGKKLIGFDPSINIQLLYRESLPFHPNGMTILVAMDDGDAWSETYYSIGGGFVIKEGEEKASTASVMLPYPVNTADDVLQWCIKTGKPIHSIVMENEKQWRPEIETKKYALHIWKVMRECTFTGCHTSGVLPGGLSVNRRAFEMNEKLLQGATYNDYSSWTMAIKNGGHSFQYVLDWVSCFALAVNEENAAFGKVVTAPTNGSAGVIPAVLHYFTLFLDGDDDERIINFLLTASEIGCVFKKGATISAAMGGCQAEIGVSSAMAAAALTEAMGGSPQQTLMAAEIAMEHHLGMTCDPIGGLVQVPCIERNTMGAIKAITASQLALQSDPKLAKVSLDVVIDTMWKTALDMNSKYKETAEGGLAVSLPISLSEC